MKSIFLIIASLCIAISSYSQTAYSGNGRSGYGGTIGKGALEINDFNDSIHIRLIRGGGTLNDAVVIYLNTRQGGFNTTASFTDQNDGLRKAISGLEGENRATLIMPVSFGADFAIAFDQGFGGLWELHENSDHTYITASNLVPVNDPSAAEYYMVVSRKDIALTPPDQGFQFLVTYVSETGYRSNEFIGDAGPADNPQNGSYTATSVLAFGGLLPLNFLNVNIQTINNHNRISWKVADQEKGGVYAIERSVDGKRFHLIGSFDATKQTEYSYEDGSPLNGNNFYRISYTGKDGKKVYSKTISAMVAARNAMKAYAAYGKVVAKIDLSEPGIYHVAVVNAYGQAILKDEIRYDGTINNFDIQLNQQLSPGIYSLMVRGIKVSLSCQFLVK